MRCLNMLFIVMAVILSSLVAHNLIGCRGEEECATAADCDEGLVCKFGDCIPDTCVDPVTDPEDKSWHMLPDRNLRQAVRDLLGLPEDRELVYRDIQGMTELDVANKNVSNISGLQCFITLKKLYLDNNRVANLSPLSGHPSLLELHLNENRVSNLTPLAEILQLQSLQLWKNHVANLKPLSGLLELSTLNLAENNISNLEALVENPGIGKGDLVDLKGNSLDCQAQGSNIEELRSRGATVFTDCDKDDDGN
ncbi:MAG: leucine-rich repeat domain-containing protein [Deltaproteobacteria bacterium]|nr:leucine-rich repeat domain-containing protein [Deltaproteobacteria bacterium]